MSRLHDLFDQQGQSPWLDNLRRDWITSGELDRWVERGVRGLTSNPTIFQKAIGGSDAYDDELAELVAAGLDTEGCYWGLVTTDIKGALAALAPVHESSHGEDGYVSVEVAPDLAHDTDGTLAAARELDGGIAAPNLYIKIPGTAEGLGAIQQATADGISVNVTLLFSLQRYDEVIEAYLSGLEAAEGDLSRISSVASFFISRVDAAVDAALDEIGSPEALALRGKTAVANGQLAYGLARRRFSGDRWDALVARGARMQRPLWASTSTKNPDYPDTKYVDELIGPDSVNTLPDATLAAFEDHGTVARTVDLDLGAAQQVLDGIAAVGVDLDAIAAQLEADGVASFSASFDDLLNTLEGRIAGMRD
ncbi:MAG: transaldolase [Actinomycetota bacterium]